MFKDRYGKEIISGDVIKVIGQKNPNKDDRGIFLVEGVYETMSVKKPYLNAEGIEPALFPSDVEFYARPESL